MNVLPPMFCDSCTRPVVVFVNETALCGPCFLEHSRGALQLAYRASRGSTNDQQVVQVLERLAAALEAQRGGSPS